MDKISTEGCSRKDGIVSGQSDPVGMGYDVSVLSLPAKPKTINNLGELSEVITAVANRAIQYGAEIQRPFSIVRYVGSNPSSHSKTRFYISSLTGEILGVKNPGKP